MFNTDDWWDKNGTFKMLHCLTNLRISWILKTFSPKFQTNILPLKNVTILDVGCGGGLMAEPLARLGGIVTGIDASEKAISCARNHNKDLSIKYYLGDINYWTPSSALYDMIIMMDVLEHMTNPFDVITRCVNWLSPNGILIGATINRTILSYMLAIIAAEYILGWIPPKTHRWRNFLPYKELEKQIKLLKMNDFKVQGFFLWPFSWRFSGCAAVNYFFSARKSC